MSEAGGEGIFGMAVSCCSGQVLLEGVKSEISRSGEHVRGLLLWLSRQFRSLSAMGTLSGSWVEGRLCCVSLFSQTVCMNVYTLTSLPPPRCFQWREQRDCEGVAFRLAFLRNGITGELEEAIT